MIVIATTFSHVNIVARDPARLAAFYIDVFDCTRSGPDRHLAGDWLGRGMGLPGARVDAIHLQLPGLADDGPTLELFSLGEVAPDERPPVARTGLMHLAFTVEDIREAVDRLLRGGGEKLGEISEANIAGVGRAEFVYARDPEGNIVELQEWKERLG